MDAIFIIWMLDYHSRPRTLSSFNMDWFSMQYANQQHAQNQAVAVSTDPIFSEKNEINFFFNKKMHWCTYTMYIHYVFPSCSTVLKFNHQGQSHTDTRDPTPAVPVHCTNRTAKPSPLNLLRHDCNKPFFLKPVS